MSKNGIWQLKKLVLSYCQHSGSSKYIRNILNTGIQEFKNNNPHIEFEDKIKSGRHPYFEAHYVSGIVKNLPLRGREEEQVLKHMLHLKEESGEKPRKFGDRYIKATQSIQGLWNPFIEFKDSNQSETQNK